MKDSSVLIVSKPKTQISFVQELTESRRINVDFIRKLDSLTLEEIIELKIELSTRYLKGRFAPLLLIKNLYYIGLEGIYRFMDRHSTNIYDSSYLLGITPQQYGRLRKFVECRRTIPKEVLEKINQETLDLLAELEKNIE